MYVIIIPGIPFKVPIPRYLQVCSNELSHISPLEGVHNY